MVERYSKATAKKAPKPTAFKAGMKRLPGAGRKPGTPNKYPSLLKEAIIKACELEGSDTKGKEQLVGFLRDSARKERAAFLSLLGKVLPLQINAKVEKTETVITKFEGLDLSNKSLEEKMALMNEMISLTQPRPEAPKLPSPDKDQGEYDEGEFTEVLKEAAE